MDWVISDCIRETKAVTVAHVRTKMYTLRPKLFIRLASDDSPYDIQSIMSHGMLEVSEKQIAFATRSLPKPKHKYAQVDCESSLVS